VAPPLPGMLGPMSRPSPCATALLLLLPTLALAGKPSPAARRWWSHVEALASDELQGRDTGSEGHRRAAEYVATKLAETGVQPGAGAGFLQEVPLVTRRLVKERSRVTLVREGKEEPLVLDQDVVLSAHSSPAGPLEAGLVFVGHGLSIPEASHDDLAGMDLKGKVIVVLYGHPPGVPGNLAAHYGASSERSKAYARAGVAGVLVVVPPKLMEVPWERVVEGRSRPVMMLADPALREGADLSLVGSLHQDAMDKLLEGSGHTFQELVALSEAGKPLPRFALSASVRSEVALETSRLTSVNVVGRLPGSDAKLGAESVVLSAHLDHVGVGAPVDGDALYNGAMDNATGVAALLEVARHFQEKKVRPRRTVLFVAVTAEEKGLLGSRFFAERPPEGSGQMVADFNMDMFLPLTPLTHLVAFGQEESSLAGPLKASAARLGVKVMKDPRPEANSFVRSDQYSFIRQGVPALAFRFGYRKGSPQEKLHLDWRKQRYHAPSDDLSQPMDREAAVRFVRLLADLTRRVADAPQRPRWNKDSFFRRFERPEAPATAQPVP